MADTAAAESCPQTHTHKHAHDYDTVEPTAKRRRVQKVLERIYECPHPGCDKSYSRQEHLSRHQLNHAPKHIYHCDHPGCDRNFVRQDLCTRHKERHKARQSGLVRPVKPKYEHETAPQLPANGHAGLIRKDSTMPSPSGSTDQSALGHGFHPHALAQTNGGRAEGGSSELSAQTRLEHLPAENLSSPVGRLHPQQNASANDDARTREFRSHSDPCQIAQAPYSMVDGQQQQHCSPSTYAQFGFPSMDSSDPRSASLTSYTPVYPDQQLSGPRSTQASEQPPPPPHSATVMHSNASIPLYTQALTSTTASSGLEDRAMLSPASQPLSELAYLPDYNHEVSYAQAFSMPVFNHDTALLTPFVSTDDFATWLLDPESALMPDGSTLVAQDMTMLNIPANSGGSMPQSFHTEGAPHPQQWSLPLSPKPLDSRISAERRKALIMYIVDEFRDKHRVRITQSRTKLLAGDHDKYPHMLSIQMLQTCLSSYWTNIDQQHPILHRPTFDPDTAPDLLILTQIALGASCLDATYGHSLRQTASEWSYFLAWHIRYKLYQDYDFGPPAKVWVFQAMLLLELFEKMYSTRELHERAHVHHATTIALMKRGSSLTAITDNAAKIEQWHQARGDFVNSINLSGTDTDDAEFSKWISAESMKRVAFMAFYLDTMHATMFGHAAAMMPHEIRIRLPCDEYTWSASSYAEVQQRTREMRQMHGDSTQMTFDEALKRTLNGRSVHTNRFGRISIMAGILSLSWHLKLQDVRVSSVGIGKKGSWAPRIFGAIDFWKHDFESTPMMGAAPSSGSNGLKDDGHAANGSVHGNGVTNHMSGAGRGMLSEADSVVEYPSVLHHLAHMTMYCDVLDYQIYAGATVALGRHITLDDRQTVTRKVRDTWAPSISGQDAVFHALKFLTETLLRKDDSERYRKGMLEGSMPRAAKLELAYHPREDVMLSRPWVLYIAVMVVWSYGYALDGVIPPPVYDLSTQQAKMQDLYGYLHRVGGVSTPEELAQVHNRNRCLGLLMVVRDMMRATRWELLHDAAASLKDCILLLMPGLVID